MIFKPIWFDSMGAKSSCIMINTDIKIVIDPGIAIMHPSFPASKTKKLYWKNIGKKKIKEACQKADVIIISHYHHDHYLRDLNVYMNKILLVKNPNEYINDSQRIRAEKFFSMFGEFKKLKLKSKEYKEPNLQSMKKEFGDYSKRRKELLKKGRKWFYKRVEKWKEYEKILETKNIKFPEGKRFKFKKTKIRCTKPFFHGIEFSRVGWIFSTVVEYEGNKIIHSSDINGPIIEDYADWIIKENPDILILDGPPTYMLGYMLNRINLERAIKNVIRIMKETDALILYDHHLPRERKFREHTKEIWEYAKKKNKKIMTAAEYVGKKPIVELQSK